MSKLSGQENLNHRIIFPSKGEVVLENFQLAEVSTSEVRIKSLYSLISIGTETTVLHQKYGPDTHFAEIFSFPQRQTGNQTVGVVEDVGADVRSLSRGDHVFIRKGHASAWTLPAKACSPIAQRIDLKTACWCGMAKIAFRAAQAAPFRLGGKVLIVGTGPVGQMAVRWAKAAGLDQIVVSDMSVKRLKLAGDHIEPSLGPLADNIDELLMLTEGEGFETIIDTTGNAAVFATALSLAKTFGKLILLGDTGFPEEQHLTSDMMRKGVSVVATHESLDRDGWTERNIDKLFFSLVEGGSINLDNLITHEFTPEQCRDAYELVSENRGEAVGVIFDWTKNSHPISAGRKTQK